jgi:hypothetical protein
MTEISVPTENPVEQLAILLGVGSSITRMSESPSASNGLFYCFVEVAEPGGSHYVIQAYGQEAVLLHEEATRHASKK